ncbi:MAG: AAA family ATPase [Chloroflexi bacterium]|nr:AAA family ATPase [Chloroflexota bacterium]
MLTRIEIENYRSLRHVELDMPGLTVLIGPNGSGKSNFLDVFNLMAQAAAGQFENNLPIDDILTFRGGKSALFSFSFEFSFASERGISYETTPVQYKLVLHRVGSVKSEQVSQASIPSKTVPLDLMRSDGHKAMFRNMSSKKEEQKELQSTYELAIYQVKDYTAYPIPYKLLNHFENWTFYQPFRVDADAPVRGSQTARSSIRLLPDGSNLTPVLHTIQSDYPVIWDEICETLKNVYEGFHHISFPAEGGDGKIVLRWWERPFEKDYGFSANLLSDGTLRLLCLLAILKTPNPPPLICIEEPEIGLHPDWIELVAELLESAATRTQVIVATHSPQLVSYVKPEHVVVVEKEDGGTTLSRLTETELAGWLDKFTLGDLWLAGHIGGRP